MGFPDVSDGKESTCNVGDLGSIPGLRRSPGEGSDYPLQYSYLENPHGQRSLAGYNPRGHKESDMTECLPLSIQQIMPYFHWAKFWPAGSPESLENYQRCGKQTLWTTVIVDALLGWLRNKYFWYISLCKSV